MLHLSPAQAARRHWMAILARAPSDALADRLSAAGPIPPYVRLRGPETGLAMVRGRTGGGGAPFNLGEMTVTRCTVRLTDGPVGHAYIAGRDARQAELAAVADAMMQVPACADLLRDTVIAPLEDDQRRRKEDLAAKAAATKVEFFSLRTMRT